MVAYKLIEGSEYSDQRGRLRFFNTLDLTEVRRFYEIFPSSTEVIRAWQGHWFEKKWFYCISGSFIVNLVNLDHPTSPSRNVQPLRFELNERDPFILEIEGKTANGFKASRDNSRLLVFSDASLDQSNSDDIRFPVDYWMANWKTSYK